jgi:FSR family fosmidomycin resistance protein-like MFS transporter
VIRDAPEAPEPEPAEPAAAAPEPAAGPEAPELERAPGPAPRPGFDRRSIGLMSSAHFVHDSYPAFVGVLLPLLIPKLGLTLAEAGLLASGMRWTTGLQPFLGYLADRFDTRYFVIAAPAVTAVSVSAIGIAPNFLAIFVLLLLSGISHASFHPAAAAVVTRMAGDRWGRGTSFFMTGGELGRALGPLYIAAVLTAVGLEWSWIAVVPGILFSVLLWIGIRRGPAIQFRQAPGSLRAAFAARRGAVVFLSGAISLRALANVSLLTFLPTKLVFDGAEIAYAGAAVAAYEIGATAGAFVGGTASDALGRRAVLAVSLAAGLPLMAVAIGLPTGLPQLLVLGVAGFALLSAMPVQLVLLHELFPGNRATATGIMYFMATIGAIVASISIGALGDVAGLSTALLVGIAAAAVGVPMILLLPRHVAPDEPAGA